MSDLTGKRALVTGAARGIGAAIAVESARGADVAIRTSTRLSARRRSLTRFVRSGGGPPRFELTVQTQRPSRWSDQ